jgi:hypothetical protein
VLSVGGVVQVVVSPSEEQLIRGELEQVTELLILSLESDQEGVVLEGDKGGYLDL